MIDNIHPTVEIENLNFSYKGKPLLNIDYLKIDKPGITVVLGPNGAGKSLLLKLIQGIEKPTFGQIRLNGIPVSDKEGHQCMVLQTPTFLRLSVYQNIAVCLRRDNFFLSQDQKNEVLAMLEKVGLGDKIKLPARLLSGGEKQKLSLARALISRPKILLVDEPTSTIDPATTSFIEDIIKTKAENDTKIIFVTHDIHQALRLARHALMIYNGKIVEEGDVERFFKTPNSPHTRDYLAGKLLR